MRINANKGDLAMLFFMFNRNAILAVSAIVIAAVVALAILYIKKIRNILVLEDMKDSAKKDLLIGLRDNAEKFSDYYEPLFVLAAGNTGRKEWVFDNWNNTVLSLENNDAFKKAFADTFGMLNSDPALIPQKDYSPVAVPDGATKKEAKKIKKLNKKIAKKAKKAAKKARKAEKKADKIAASQKKTEKFEKKQAKEAEKLYTKKAYKLIKLLKKAGVCRDNEFTVTADESTAEKYDVIGNVSLVSGAKYDVHIPYWALTKKTKVFPGEEATAEIKEYDPASYTEEAPVEEATAPAEEAYTAPVETVDAQAEAEAAPVETADAQAEAEAAPAVPAESTASEAVSGFDFAADFASAPSAAVAETPVAAVAETPVAAANEPEKKVSKRKAKKAAKKEKKANKKAAKKAKKAAKKGETVAEEPQFTINETTILVAKGAIK